MSEISASVPTTQSQQQRRIKGIFDARRISLAMTALAVLLLVAGTAWVYSSQVRNLSELREANAALTTQLAQSQQEARDRQAEVADAQTSGKALADQLAQSKVHAEQASQQAEATLKGLQAEKSDLAASLSASQSAANIAQAESASLTQKATNALAKAQLLDEYYGLLVALRTGGSQEDFSKGYNAWFRKLYILNDPTIGDLMDEYDAAIAKNPKDTTAYGKFMAKLLGYLSNSVVTELQ